MNASLMDAAQRLEAQAEQLMEEVRTLRRQAADYRVQATKDERRVEISHRPKRTVRASDLSVDALGKLVDAVEAIQPVSTRSLAEHLAISEARVRSMCEAAEEMNLVARTGPPKSIRWTVAEPSEAPPVSDEIKVRDALVELDQAVAQEVALHAGVDDETARRWLHKFEEKGLCRHEQIDGVNLYEYVTPEKLVAHQRKRFTPAEIEVVDRRVSGPATTSNRRRTVAGSQARKLVKDLRDAGAEIVTAGSGKHHKVVLNGEVVGGLSKGMGWDGDVKAARERFRKKGVKV